MLYNLTFPIYINSAREALVGRYEYVPIRPYIQDIIAAKCDYKSTTSSLTVNFVYDSESTKSDEKEIDKYLKVIAFSRIPQDIGVNYKFLGAIEHPKRKPYYIYGKITTLK